VEAWESAHVEARESAHVVAWGSAHVEAWGSAHVVAWGSAHVEAWESAAIHLSQKATVQLHGFSVAWIPADGECSASCVSDTARIQSVEPLPFLERDGIKAEDGSVVLYKRVSKDFKTQENTERETLWAIGATLEHPAWKPETSECGEGKYHACSRAYFADEFRKENGDRYIAIRVAVTDLYEWPNPSYSHKIAFRRGTVLYECDRYGERRGA
jgi:hypothetical protein